MKLKAFTESMRLENLGFAFGEPWRHGQATSVVVPIIRVTEKEKEYFILSEVMDKVEIKDTGSIDKVEIENKTDKPVFIRMGEILKGGTQERTVVFSRVISPGQKEVIEVKCVHASKGIRAGAKFFSGGYMDTSRDVMFAKSAVIGANVSQSVSWSSDRSYRNRASCYFASVGDRETVNEIEAASEDDYAKVSEKIQDTLKEVIKKCPLVDNQIGIALIDANGLHSLDCFDVHASWRVVKESLVGREALKLAEEDKSGVFEYKPKRAKKIIQNVLKQGFEEKEVFKSSYTKTIALKFNGYVGEAVLIGEDDLVHLLIVRESE